MMAINGTFRAIATLTGQRITEMANGMRPSSRGIEAVHALAISMSIQSALIRGSATNEWVGIRASKNYQIRVEIQEIDA